MHILHLFRNRMSSSDDYGGYNDSSSEDECDQDEREYCANSKLLMKLNQSSPTYTSHDGRWCDILTARCNKRHDHFFPDRDLYLNLRSLELKKRYVSIFLDYDEYYSKKEFPSDEEKELIMHHVDNTECDDEFLRTCFNWASYYELIFEQNKFFGLLKDVNNIWLHIQLFKTNDEYFIQKLVNHPQFTDFSEAFKYACIHSDNWTIVKTFLNKDSEINEGIFNAIRCKNNNVVKQLIGLCTHETNELIVYLISENNIDIINLLLEKDSTLENIFVKTISNIFIGKTNPNFQRPWPDLLKLFMKIINNSIWDNLNEALLGMIIVIPQDHSYKIKLLIGLINSKNNTITDYNKLFEEILKNCSPKRFIEIYNLIPNNCNKINSDVKQIGVNKIKEYHCSLEIIQSLLNILGELTHANYGELTLSILQKILKSFNSNSIEMLQLFVSRKPTMIKLVDTFQERIYLKYCTDKHFKLWIKYFPANKEVLLNVISEAYDYQIEKLLLHDGIRDILEERYIPIIFDKLISIINKPDAFEYDFCLLHSLIVKSNLTNQECIDLGNQLLDDSEYPSVIAPILLLRLKIYDFDKIQFMHDYIGPNEYVFNMIFSELEYQIEIDWCMRQYILHDQNARVIWTFILKNKYTLSYKNVLFCNYTKQFLNADIILNICLLMQLMDFWEAKNNDLGIFYDYKIVGNHTKLLTDSSFDW